MAFLAINKKKVAPGQKVEFRALDNTQIGLTESAAKRVQTLLSEAGLSEGYLRVGIQGGGCSGFSYLYAVEKDKRENDHVFEGYGSKILVDPKSLQLIGGSWVDFEDHLMTKGFKLVGKQGHKSCSCGRSFGL